MIPVKLHPVFPLFLWIAAAWCLVEPPTNLTLQCHNLQNTLEWSYGRFLPGLRFKVDIRKIFGSPSVLWVDPPALWANVSAFSDPTNEYLVFVTAVLGRNESVTSNKLTYSYFMDSISSQKCSVDLPPVAVTSHPDDNVMFHFTHPWLWHYPVKPDNPGSKLRKKKSHDKQQLPEFKYGVVIVGQKDPHHFNCVESVCEQKFLVGANLEKHCLNITGELEKMTVKSTQLYCAMPMVETPGKNNNIIYIFVSVLGVCVLAFFLFLVYKKMTSPKTAHPKSMSIGTFTQGTTPPDPEQFSDVTVEPSSPTPLLSNEEEPEFTPAAARTESPVLRLRTGVTNAEEVLDEVGNQSDEGQGYMRGSSLDEDEPQNNSESGYEKRAVLVKMGSGELLQAYRS
ncbi:interferon gamma receptor 1-like isoform X1 [Hippoglossus stenolepis]|uniref:interferon gamma receptor 1-like isoform X1 n=1 Tax=Hippoglossus stenolepis TaxID=195615 RepID=UPI00159C5C36|nr:interferon gamma receptor 1-like isoform X1 [Hippoglossus stenolepis]